MKRLATLLLVNAVCLGCWSTASAAIVIRDDDFRTNTRDDYTALGIHFGSSKVPGDWTVSGGVLDVADGTSRHGMLAIEGGAGNPLTTPDHFSIAFSFTPSPIDTQDHPGIAFDRNGTNARVLYLRTHSNQAVAGFTTAPNSISTTSAGTSGLSVGTSYDLLYEVNYLTQTARVDIFGSGGGPLIDSATFSGATFTSNYGTNTGGAFGLLAFNTEGALIDNLVVTDFTRSVPEPSALGMLGLATVGLRRRGKPRRRRVEQPVDGLTGITLPANRPTERVIPNDERVSPGLCLTNLHAKETRLNNCEAV